MDVFILKEFRRHVRYRARWLIFFVLLMHAGIIDVALTRVEAIHNFWEVLAIFQCVLGLAAVWQNGLHTAAKGKWLRAVD